MADFTGSTHVDRDDRALFDYLSDVSHLPDYFAKMTHAKPGDGAEVHTRAAMPDGQEVEGDAWFRVDESARRIEWGSEGPSGYHGHLAVSGDGDGSRVEVHISTERVPEGRDEVTDGIEETLVNIKRIVEGG